MMAKQVVGLFLLCLFNVVRETISKNPEERYTTQPLNHYDDDKEVNNYYQQRYFWVPPPKQLSKTIFFYAGNEANVEAYVANCGLMWENANEFNAALVFAEHRFWGKSQPNNPLKYEYAGPNQAIEDYFHLINSLLKNETSKYFVSSNVKIIVFGGSYGGMLAAWMRLINPSLISVAVASSAPILAFPDSRKYFTQKRSNFYRDGGASYWKVVTKVFAPCAEKIHLALKSVSRLNIPTALSDLGVCENSKRNSITHEDVLTWIGYALETMCMGDYHFPSNYITGKTLPPRPATLSCNAFLANKQGGLKSIRDAVGIMFNVTKNIPCYEIPNRREASFYDGLWDQYWCRWLIPQETYFEMKGPPNDMFLSMPLDWEDIAKHCKETVFATPDYGKSIFQWFGAVTEEDWIKKGTNIIFANGGHDPWSAGGFYSKINPKLIPIFIPSGAHHEELMFSRDDDPDDLIEARSITMEYVKKWIQEEEEPVHAQVS